jgi:formate hydrogenlyase subunit 3/multisubunit Na+/H+ antiporter MnhD subunit
MGKIKGMSFPFYFWLTGKDAKAASSVLAILLILLGVFVLVSAIFHLDC